MKRLLFILSMLLGVAYGQICADEDTVRSNSVSLITYNSARINGTTSHFSGSVSSLQLKYVRVGQTDTVTSSGSSALRNITGLQANTQYYYYYKSICGSGSMSQTIGAYTFTTLANNVAYTPMDAMGYQFKYLKVDTLLQFVPGDTSVSRGGTTNAAIKYKSSDNTFYGYYPSCNCWRALAIDSAGIISLLNGKVDSVTVSGDSLFYWKQGVSYGYILPSLNNVWRNTGNTGIDTSVNWLGTNDNKALVIRTNNTRRLIIDQAGKIIQPDSLIWDLNNKELIFYTNGKQVNFEADDPGDVVIHTHAVGDVAERLQIQADGHLEWGPGTGAIDVGLTRIAASELQLSGFGGNDTKLSIDADGSSPTDSAMIQFTHNSTSVDTKVYFDHANSRFGITSGDKFYLHNTSNVSTQDRILGIVNSSARVGNITIGSGLSLSSGVLSSTVTGLAIGNTVTSATAGSIFFAGTGGTLQQKNSTLFFDSTYIRLGLGTNSPASLLNAVGGVCDFRFSKGLADVTPSMTVINTSGMAGGLIAGTSGSAFVYDNAGPFYLISESHSAFVNNTLGGGTVRMTLTATGELGINTTSPAEKLEVDGNAKVTGKFIGRNVIYRTLNASDADFTAAVGTAYVLPDPSTGRTITLPTGQDADKILFYLPVSPSNSWNLSTNVTILDGSTVNKLDAYGPGAIYLIYDGANSVWRLIPNM